MELTTERITNLLLCIPALVMGLTIHEFAHAWAADRLGDDTPRRMGRLTLDPMSHLDPFGSIAFIMCALSGFMGVGWAKPVPFNPRNLNFARRDSVLIAIAGPVSNVLQVPFWLFLLYLTRFLPAEGVVIDSAVPQSMQESLIRVLEMGVLINLMMATFNMIPLPPLDGHHVLAGLGPPAVAEFYNSIRQYSFIILIVVLNLPGNPVGHALAPVFKAGYQAVWMARGLY